jgi:type II secretory pathway component GspD/PulD (secretin)
MSTRTLSATFAALALAVAGFAQTAPAAPATATAQPKAADAVTVQGADTAKTPGSATRDHDTLSVDFPDEEIKTILRNVADLFELNLVVPDTLTGKTSIKLRDVTWRQIFKVVLDPAGYTYVEEGNIIKIISKDSLEQEATVTEVIILNNAKAADIKPTIDGLVDSAKGGKLLVEARSNALIVTERPSRITHIRSTIEQLDKATDQVMIESKFVEVSDADIRNIGVNWTSLNGMQFGVTKIAQQFGRDTSQRRQYDNAHDLRNSTDTTNSNTQRTGTANTTGTTVTTTNGTTNLTNNDTNTTTTNGTNSTSTTTNSGATNTSSTQTNTGNQLLTNPVTGVSTVTPINSTGTLQTTTTPATSTNSTNGTTGTSITNTTVGSTAGTNASTTNGTSGSTLNNLSTDIVDGITRSGTDALSSLTGLTNLNTTERLASAVFNASDFNVIISALKTQANTKIVSNPTVVTLNNIEAVINVGEEDPIPHYAFNQQTGTYEVTGFDTMKIGVILKVTPQVNARGIINLKLAPEVSQKAGTANFGQAQIPIKATRSVTTQVALKNGNTVGLGGLMTTNRAHGGTKVPILGDIPLLGKLFSSKSVNDTTSNLLIFVTARTVNAEGASPEEVFGKEQLDAVDYVPASKKAGK